MSGDQAEGRALEMVENPSDSGGSNKEIISATSGDYNPMLNPVVLERLFAICALQDLRRFRQVCTLWNEVALPRWRNQMTVSIYEIQYDPSFYNLLGGAKLTCDIADQIFMPPFDAMPYRSYRIWKFHFPLGTNPSQKLTVEAFLVSNGSWMRELTLDEPEIVYENAVALKRVIFELTPNLKLLALRGMQSVGLVYYLRDDFRRNQSDDDDDGNPENDENQEESDDEDVDKVAAAVVVQPNLKILKVSLHPLIARLSDWFPVSWREYLMHFPNIERIEMGNSGADRIQTFVEALEANNELGTKITKLDLQETKMEVSDIRRILSIPQLKLDELHVQIPLEDDLDSSDEDDLDPLYYHFPELVLHNPELPYPCPVELQSFVHEQAPILHTLHLRTNYLDDQVRFNFFQFHVSMDSLTKLVLRGNITNNWNFLRNTPNLKTVHVFKFDLTNMFLKESYKDVEQLGVRCPCLEELRLKSVRKKDTSAEDSIEVQIPFHTLKYLAKCMPNLKVLEAPLANETFRLVCKNWTGVMRELHDSNSELKDEGITGIRPFWKQDRRYPNITQLQCLEVFTTSSLYLTDTSVTEGFLRCTLLHTVAAPMSTLISGRAQEHMRCKFSWYSGRDIEMESFSDEEW